MLGEVSLTALRRMPVSWKLTSRKEPAFGARGSPGGSGAHAEVCGAHAAAGTARAVQQLPFAASGPTCPGVDAGWSLPYAACHIGSGEGSGHRTARRKLRQAILLQRIGEFDARKKERGIVSSLDAPIFSDDEDSNATRDVPDLKAAPEILFSRKELGGQIETALAKLPPKLRSAVVLHDVEGLAYEEIAAVEGIPLGTVKSRIFNARVALREHLRPYLES